MTGPGRGSVGFGIMSGPRKPATSVASHPVQESV
jgi:hypothetical protein